MVPDEMGTLFSFFLLVNLPAPILTNMKTLFSTCNVLLLNFSNFLRSEAFRTETGRDNGCGEGIEMRRFDHGRAGVRA